MQTGCRDSRRSYWVSRGYCKEYLHKYLLRCFSTSPTRYRDPVTSTCSTQRASVMQQNAEFFLLEIFSLQTSSANAYKVTGGSQLTRNNRKMTCTRTFGLSRTHVLSQSSAEEMDGATTDLCAPCAPNAAKLGKWRTASCKPTPQSTRCRPAEVLSQQISASSTLAEQYVHQACSSA